MQLVCFRVTEAVCFSTNSANILLRWLAPWTYTQVSAVPSAICHAQAGHHSPRSSLVARISFAPGSFPAHVLLAVMLAEWHPHVEAVGCVSSTLLPGLMESIERSSPVCADVSNRTVLNRASSAAVCDIFRSGSGWVGNLGRVLACVRRRRVRAYVMTA